MKFFRNPEISSAIGLSFAATAVASAYVFSKNTTLGFVTAGLGIVLSAIYLIAAFSRYNRINEISADINKILHSDDAVMSMSKYTEGELSILESEVHKMTIRLREQQQKLLDDKIYLADSIADISHQIRTPLTSINLLCEFLSEEKLSDEKRLKYTRDLMKLLKRIDWLITALLKMSKLDAGTAKFKKETMPVSTLIDKATSPLLVPIELREQRLEINASGEFSGDLQWTCEAIGNIVKNCMEHTPVGGTLTIDACENPLYTEIVICDTGCGISDKDLPHIFERFYKGENSSDQSFGIGLALARMIITSQNGTIKAENRKDCGMMFTIKFYKSAV